MGKWEQAPLVEAGKWSDAPVVSDRDTDPAMMTDEQMPEEARAVADRVRNAYYYSRNLGISSDDAYDYEPQINEALYGPGTTSQAAWGRTSQAIMGARRKTAGEALKHGYLGMNQMFVKSVTGLGRQLAEVKGVQHSLIDPAFRWMFGLPKDINLDKMLVDMADAAAQDIKDSQQEHPEMGYAIDPDAGYAESLWQTVTRPENLLQGLVENSAIVLEGALGTMVGGPAGGIAAMGVPISGTVYQDARAQGTGIMPAFAQAVATGGIEGAIEQWTLGRKIALGKNFRRMLQQSAARRVMWEGTKAFFRGTAEEGTQEFNANFWRWVFTDRSQKWFQNVDKAMAMGGPLELLMSGGFAAAGATGAPVKPDEAYRRLEILRKSVRQAADLNEGQRREILDMLDKVPQMVPEIFGIEVEGGEAEAAEPVAPAPAVRAEAPAAPVAGGAEKVTAGGVEQAWGATNIGVTRAEYEAIKAKRQKRTVGEFLTSESGEQSPEDWLDLLRIGRFHLEAGARAFTDWAKRMIADFGSAVEPQLDSVWKKVQAEPQPEELVETSEEARIAETKLAGEGAETVEPYLYIGNVTARMKGSLAIGLSTPGHQVKAEEIGPYKEGAWPTKRTKIQLTRAQAEEYLAWLEKDLQRRLDENAITTYDEMAQANADWGDVKALRRVLGISEKLTADIKAAKRERTRLKKELKRIQKQQAKPSGADKLTPARAAERIDQLDKAIAKQDEIIASAGRPWRIIYAQQQGTVARDQGELDAAQKEIDRLRGEFDRAKTEVEAEEILAQIEAKQLEMHKLQQALGKSAKITKKTGESIRGAVTPSTLQESKMTVQEVLRAVMQRVARTAKMSYAQGRRELRADLRVKARAKARMDAAIATIKRTVPRTVDVVYREAIEAIKNTIDPSFRSEKALKERESARAYLKRHPEKAAEMPTKLLDTLSKKPLNEYTIEELEAIAAKIEQLKDLGGLRRKLEVTQYERGKQKDLQAIAVSSTPLTERDMIRPEKIGQELTWQQRAKNTLNRMLDAAKRAKRAVAVPMDVFFDMLDGAKNYLGANYRIFKKPLDIAYSRYLDLRDEMATDVVRLANEFGLQRGNFERIGVHAALQQEGGRQKLLDTGYTDAQIDEVKLTADEMQLYNLMREKLDELAPAIEDVMANVYNEPLQRVANYFSFMTDFEAMSDFEMRDRFGDRVVEFSSALRKNTERGFTITRRGGFQKIKVNAMEIFLQHVDNASYLVEMGADIKRLAEIAATPEYGMAVGTVGQKEVREWLDLMARKGKVDRNKSIYLLDIFRKHTGAAMIGFKLSSALVNITPLLDGAGLIGQYAFRGASDVATNRDWREFLMRNFPELRDRVGGDIEFLEFGNTGLEKLERAGFWLLQKIDGIAAASIASGSYQKYLDEHGLKMDFENPHAEAVAYAQRTMRRSQSSAFFKDLPSAYTRGTFTGNKSVDRLLLQFQSFVLNRWSLIEHDMIRAGIKSGNMGQAMNIFLFLTLAGFAELGLRRLTKELIAMLTGEELDDWSETFTKEMVVNSLQNVPFLSQAVSVYNYGDIPVPTLSLLQDMTQKWEALKRTKNPDKKRLKALELLIMTTGTVAGIPGTLQVSEVVRSAGKQPQAKLPKH